MHIGIPDKVNDLTVVFSHSLSTSVYNISWSPPQTLQGVKVYYQVEVATCTHMHIAEFEGTHLIHTLPHHNVSQAVNVIAANPAGTGAATSHSSSLPNFVVQLVATTQGIKFTKPNNFNDSHHSYQLIFVVISNLLYHIIIAAKFGN